MITLLPAPREMRYSGEDFQFTGAEKLFFVEGEDAVAEVLRPALQKVGSGLASAAGRLSSGDENILIIARDATQARTLERRAIAGLEEALPKHKQSTLACDEMYYLAVTTDGIVVRGYSRRALFWGVQTLVQVFAGTQHKTIPGLVIRDWPVQEIRGLHLNMTHLLAKPAAIRHWLRGVASLKINTVLFEYADKFPYQYYRFLRHASAMTPTELKKILDTARRHHIQVIPLVQTLGHLEYALKHKQLSHLREMPDIYHQLCPSSPASLQFVTKTLDEVMEYHPDAEYFHVGGGETCCLGECSQCREAARRDGEIGLYLQHMTPLLKHILERGKKPILQDDLLRVRADKISTLPREVVLAYTSDEVTDGEMTREAHSERELPASLQKFYKTKNKRAALWPDTLNFLPFLDFYQQHGFEVLATSGTNAGVGLIENAISACNTLKIAEKTTASKALGMFHSPQKSGKTIFAATWYGSALTATSTWNYPPADITAFDNAFSRLILGEPDSLVVAAMRLTAENVSFQIPGAKRASNVLHFAMEDMDFYNSNDLDFAVIVQRKLENVQADTAKPAVLARLDWVQAQMQSALRLLDHAHPNTVPGKELQKIARAIARFKATRIQTMRLLLGEPGGFPSPQHALRAEEKSRRELQRLYSRTIRAPNVRDEMRVLFEGEIAALAAMQP